MIFCRQHAVYRFYDADGVLLYIGATSNIFERWYQHGDKNWFHRVAVARVAHFTTRAEALAAESLAIGAERPLLNRITLSNEHSVRRAAARRSWAPRDSSGDLRALLEHVEDALYLNRFDVPGLHDWRDRNAVEDALQRAQRIVSRIVASAAEESPVEVAA